MMAGAGAWSGWALVVFSTTLLVTQSLIFRPLRRRLELASYWLGKLVHCPMCFGFWAGAFWHLVGAPMPAEGPLWLLRSAIASSGVCWVFHVVLVHLGADDL